MATVALIYVAFAEKTCSHPDEIKNGRVVSGQLHFGAKVSYDCDSCFYLSGPKERECLGNETWSGVKPVCKRKSSFTLFKICSYFIHLYE